MEQIYLYRGVAKGVETPKPRWVYGHLFKTKDQKAYIVLDDAWVETPYGEDVLTGFIEVEPETVDQYTGFRDKNEQRIFVHDICKSDARPDLTFTVVFGGTWNYAAFGLEASRPKGDIGSDPTWECLNPQYAKGIEVVGSIVEDIYRALFSRREDK